MSTGSLDGGTELSIALQLPPGKELDAAVDKLVLNWPAVKKSQAYSTDIAAAWEVHKRMKGKLRSVRMRYVAWLQVEVSERLGVTGLASLEDVLLNVTPQDICRAALRTLV